jgi:hypothetical protein
MAKKNIYILKLEQSKMFLYLGRPTNRPDAPILLEASILLEAELYYDYLKKYKPICIISKIDDVDVLDIDKYVKIYDMFWHR